MGNATIKDVAAEAQVSIATVSRVLNKNYVVSPELEAKVMAAIEKLNYYPNSIARSLKNENTHTIGLIVSDIANEFFTALARSIEDIIAKRGYNLIVCSTDNRQDKEYSYLQLLMEKKVDAIILNTTGLNDEYIASLSQKIPFGLCGRKVNALSFKGDFVDSDNVTGSYELTRYLLSLGHRKIALINGQTEVSSSAERLEGFCKAMKEAGIDVEDSYPYLYFGNFNRKESGYQGAEAMFSMANPPSAIFAANNELALGVMRYCLQHGISIPEDLSLTGYGRISNADLLYVQLLCTDMSPQVMGTRLAELTMERIEQKNNILNREIRFSPQLIPGKSVREYK